MCLKSIVNYVNSSKQYAGAIYIPDNDDGPLLVVRLEIKGHTQFVMVSERDGVIYLQVSFILGTRDQRLDLSQLSDECRLCVFELINAHHQAKKPTIPYIDYTEGTLGIKVYFSCPGSSGDVKVEFESALLQVRQFILRDLKALLQLVLDECKCISEEFDSIKELELFSGD